MEFLKGGSLEDLLKKRRKKQNSLTHAEMIRLALGISSGLVHLHAEKILHRDLAARNILIDGEGDPKIADFGLSFQNAKKGDDDGATTLVSTVGPIRWMAPESIAKHTYSVKTDVYSFGVLLFELCSMGSLPLEEYEPAKLALLRRDENLTPQMPKDAPEVLVKLAQDCWETDPDLRPTFKMIARTLHEAEEALSEDDEEEPASPRSAEPESNLAKSPKKTKL